MLLFAAVNCLTPILLFQNSENTGRDLAWPGPDPSRDTRLFGIVIERDPHFAIPTAALTLNFWAENVTFNQAYFYNTAIIADDNIWDTMETFQRFRDWFWSEWFWLPPPLTWSQLKSNEHTRLPETKDLYYVVLLTFFIILVRKVFER